MFTATIASQMCQLKRLKKFIKNLIGKFRPFNKVTTPTILQFGDTECGVAALAILFAYYQHYVPIEILRQKCGTSRDGSKATTLLRVARDYGFEADAFRVELDFINHLKNPVIAFWNFSHYVVIDGLGSNCVFINDPTCGSFKVSLAEFDKSFSGVIIDIVPTDKIIKLPKERVVKNFITNWLENFKTEISFILLCLAIGLCAPLFNSALSNIFIDQIVVLKNISWIPYIAGALTISAFLFGLISVVQKWHQYKFHTKASIIKSSKIINHILKLPLLFYFLRQKAEIVAIITRAESVIALLAKTVSSYLVGSFAIIICLIFMARIDVMLTFLSVLILVICLITTLIIAKINFLNEKLNVNFSAKIYAYLISNLRNLETIKICSFEEKIFRKYYALLCQKLTTEDKVVTLNAASNSINKFYNSLAILTILCLGAWRVSGGIISVGNLIAYYGLHLFFTTNLNNLIQSFRDAQTAYASHIRINDYLQYQTDHRFEIYPSPQPSGRMGEQEKVSKFEAGPKMISGQNIDFYYDKNSNPTLQNISLEIRQGEHIALVGTTGSGKSTLAKLLAGLYLPNSGNIKLLSQDLSDLSVELIAKYIAYVNQEISLFCGTIYDNLNLCNHNPALENIYDAINDTCLTDLIASRNLYGAVEENGNNFSGGERQRIDIARALIQDTPILVLDEATSALDVITEQKLINNLRRKNKTIIFVAHRLSTVKHCNQILVINQGTIIERGDHQTLMQKKGHYYNLTNSENITNT